MKTKRVTQLFALLVAGLMISVGSLSPGQTPRRGKSLNVSKYGTLLEILDANGKSRFGKLGGEGFQLSYDYKGKTTSVTAVGDAEVEGLAPGEVKPGRQSTTVVTRTNDQALEITTYFFVNEKTNKLMIQRKFKNISKDPVVVKTMLEYVDPALVAGVPRNLKGTEKEIAAVLMDKLKAVLVTGDCIPECPDEPPPCPQPCPTEVKFDFDRMKVRTNPASGRPDSIALRADTITLLPNTEVFQHLFLAF